MKYWSIPFNRKIMKLAVVLVHLIIQRSVRDWFQHLQLERLQLILGISEDNVNQVLKENGGSA